ncbi:MAG: LptF/LptG family permease [Panacagrimonas sp.]
MSRVLGRYLRRRVALQTLGLLLVLTALMQLLEMLDVTGDVLDRQLGAAGLLRYAFLRTPAELVVALPLAALLGAMSAFYAMARHHEIVAMRCAGLSLKRLVVLLLPVPLVLAGVQFMLSDRVVPRAEATLKAWWDATAPEEEEAEPRWVQTRDGPVSILHASPDGRELREVHIYQRDEKSGLLTARLRAARATWADGSWHLAQVEHLDASPTELHRQKQDRREWSINLRPDDVLRLDLAQPHLSSMMLVDVIAGERVGAQPISFYQTVLYRSFTAPLAVFVMLLLAAPTARLTTRAGGGASLLVALGLGLGYLLCDGIMAALGTGGRLPPVIAVSIAPALFLFIGIVHLEYCDRS